MVPLARPPAEERPAPRSGRDDHVRFRIHAGDPVQPGRPRMIGDQRDIAQPIPRDIEQRADVLGARDEGAALQIGRLAGQRIDGAPHFSSHVVVERVRLASPDGAAAVHPKLLEVPFARSNIRDAHRPHAVGTLGETAEDPAAVKDRPVAFGGLVRNRRLGSTTDLGREHDRFAQVVCAVGEHHAHGSRLGAGRLELADGIARSGQTGKRTVGAVRVRLGQPARPTVITVGENVESHGRRRGKSHRRRRTPCEARGHDRHPSSRIHSGETNSQVLAKHHRRHSSRSALWLKRHCNGAPRAR